MRKFRFRLDRVLRLKQRAEKAARMELGRALSQGEETCQSVGDLTLSEF